MLSPTDGKKDFSHYTLFLKHLYPLLCSFFKLLLPISMHTRFTHLVIHLMTLHILHNTHVYHHPPIPNLFTFFLTTFSLFTTHHILHFFPPLHGHAWPHHTPYFILPMHIITLQYPTYSHSFSPHFLSLLHTTYPFFFQRPFKLIPFTFAWPCMTMLTSILVATLHPIPCTWPFLCPSCPSSHSHLIPLIPIPI